MRLLMIAIAICTLLQIGCAAGVRAGGENRGVGAGVAVDPFYPPPSSPSF